MFQVVLHFTLLGPLAGGIAFWMASGAGHSASLAPFPAGGLVALTGPLMGVLFYPISLLIGGVPAGVAGLAFWAVARRLPPGARHLGWRFLLGAVIGGLLATGCGLALLLRADVPAGFWSALAGLWSLPGAAGGGTCAALITARRWRKWINGGPVVS